MGKLIFDIEKCYGLNDFKYDIDTKDNYVNVIHASNGIMKTSLIKTISDINLGNNPIDNVRPSSVSKAKVTLDGVVLGKDDFYVVKSNAEDYESEKISNLLLNNKLRKDFDLTNQTYTALKKEFIKQITRKSGIKEEQLDLLFEVYYKKKNFDDNLVEIFKVIQSNRTKIDENILIKYDLLFSQKIEAFVSKPEVKGYIKKYIKIIEKLNKSKLFFLEGKFEINNLIKVKEVLENNNYFLPANSLKLNGYNEEIKSSEELEKLITELYKIKKQKTDISGIIRSLGEELFGSEPMRKFNSLIQSNNLILTKYANIINFKKEYLENLVFSEIDLCEQLIKEISKHKNDLEKIYSKAKSEVGKWEEIIKLFNSRFNVPFKLSLGNLKDSVLGLKVPVINFDYDGLPIERDRLRLVLSTGESRALYLLNIMFDIKSFEKDGVRKVMFFDDIADSFDYKNKHAIILYLKDISENNLFNIIILTHNFDFYRTCGNLISSRNMCYFAMKDKSKIYLEKGQYFGNVFTHFIENANKDDSYLLASIPFARNIHEFNKKNKRDNSKYKFYTDLLHYRFSGLRCTMIRVSKELNTSFPGNSIVSIDSTKIYKKWADLADKISTDPIQKQNLERKIILSTASRLCAEKYIFRKIKKIEPKINYKDFNKSFGVLLGEYKKHCSTDKNMKLLEDVAKLSPESIHMNAFMFEPLIDYSEDMLKSIYQDVKIIGKLN